MPDNVLIPVSVGELFDKISILEIKAERIRDHAKLQNIELELRLLREVAASVPQADPAFSPLRARLRTVNEAIWDGEERIRCFEKQASYGPEFVTVLRTVHHDNDRRAEIKRRLNLLAGSVLVEEKSFALPEGDG